MISNKTVEIPYQMDNPTREDRRGMLKYLLSSSGRAEDFDNIVGLLSPPPDITTVCPKGKGKKIRVAVIGAGEAGLAAAFELRKIGCSITLFEATDRVGGRILTYYFDKGRKYFGELGAMRIPPSHETTWHYIDLFKLSTSPFVTKNVNGLFYLRDAYAVNDPKGYSVMRNIYPRFSLPPDERRVPWQKLAGRIIEKYLDPLPPEVRRELLEIKPAYSPAIQVIDTMNLRAAYESTGISQNAISMIGFLSTFEQTFLNLSLTEILQESYTADFAYTYRIDGGMINLPMALYKALCDEAGNVYGNIGKEELGKIILKIGFAVDGMYESPEGSGVILEYRDSRYFNSSFEKFDYVICAIPFSSLRRVRVEPRFRVMKYQAVAELNYEIGQKTFLFLKDRFWEMWPPSARIVGGSSGTDLPVISVFYPSDHALPVPGKLNQWTLRPGASPMEPGVLLASYNWAQDDVRLGSEHKELLIYDVTKYIERIHGLPPGYIDKKLISYVSLKWSEAQYIWSGACLTKPEDKILFSYAVTLPEMGGKVFFAGEHISQKHAWQQGALQTGMIAANQVAERVKHSNA